MANYYEQVFQVVRTIPYGKVCTYGIIADYLALGSARMVGWALNNSFGTDPPIPAHRVVNRKGELSGRNHFATPDLMEQMLVNEGLIVKNNRIVNFEENLWKPY